MSIHGYNSKAFVALAVLPPVDLQSTYEERALVLLNPPARMPAVLAGPVVSAPGVCAIPLLRVIPPGTSDKMPAIKPASKVLKGDTVQVPAPACGESLFTNK
jgi:hypothetical protein